MPATLHPDAAAAATDVDALVDDAARMRTLSRSPHPYHHQRSELSQLSDRFQLQGDTPDDSNDGSRCRTGDETETPASVASPSSLTKTPTTPSESGTEADDESYLKGLPAPKVKLHKGLRGRNEPLSGVNTPLPSPGLPPQDAKGANAHPCEPSQSRRRLIHHLRRRRNWVRRATEAGLIVTLGFFVARNPWAAPLVSAWTLELTKASLLYGGLLALYPVRVAIWQHRQCNLPLARAFSLHVPSNFDPATLIYPPAITLLVTFLVAASQPTVVLPNLIIALSTIPEELLPSESNTIYPATHWLVSCLPIWWETQNSQTSHLGNIQGGLSQGELILLYPLHRTLCGVLQYLTSTSLLEAELQLLSVGLINVLLLATSPQMQILKSLLWVGGMILLLACGSVIRSGIALARVPKWRFQPPRSLKPNMFVELWQGLTWFNIRNEVFGEQYRKMHRNSIPKGTPPSTSDEDGDSPILKSPPRARTGGFLPDSPHERRGAKTDENEDDSPAEPSNDKGITRRHTLSHHGGTSPKFSKTHTPSGRRKRAHSVSARPFLRMTYAEAMEWKWVYAVYVYVCMYATIAYGTRTYIEHFALDGQEPIGWGLGYAFGDLPWFRWKVIEWDWERWVCLPPRSEEGHCELGTIQHIRHATIGEANTRLFITGYWFLIFVVGLMVVFRLQNIYEVDTRRKVFHFMMVGMLLPATFIDPMFAALVLALVLAVFLMLDLLRASQLPPLSKPIAAFLTPYVDGRDFRGPVVISHIFLLIGCAIPLWLALASLTRSPPDAPDSPFRGWEVPTRDVSMVAGVVCVGLGDAAASLIGRRYGHRKWLWGGGKSVEGSVGFALAVFAGLSAASAWLHVGGWTRSGAGYVSLPTQVAKTAVCASMASVTEAVLTGGNDNVIVPVVLWTCVKSLGI